MSGVHLPRLLISAARKSSGKTLVTLGLAQALQQQGQTVQLFKKGPDYIDPMWHKAASNRESYNLDSYLMGNEACQTEFVRRANGAHLSLIEGNLGLHDGLDLDGSNSSAALARLLAAPVLLVMDAMGMNRNIAALVHGLQTFEEGITIGGVVLNRVRSTRQQEKQVAVIEHYCGVPVVGAIPVLDKPPITERHLGLVTPQEAAQARQVIAQMGEIVSHHLNLEQVGKIAAEATPLEAPQPGVAPDETTPGPVATTTPEKEVTIAVAWDPAFCFYYRDNLEALVAHGARLVFFDALRDTSLPPLDGLYLGGGFPESFPAELSANHTLRQDIATKIQAGLPTYAECGGMMYLARSMTLDGKKHEMCGVIPADVTFQKRPVGYGYVDLVPNGEGSWFPAGEPIRGHEFHYSRLENPSPDLRYLYQVERGAGMGEGRDGIILHNLLASYAHIHTASAPHWASAFVAAVRAHQAQNKQI